MGRHIEFPAAGRTTSQPAPLDSWTPKNMGIAVDVSFLSCLQADVLELLVWKAAILDFLLPVWSHIIHFSSIGLFDFKNMGVAAGISFLSPLDAEI